MPAPDAELGDEPRLGDMGEGGGRWPGACAFVEPYRPILADWGDTAGVVPVEDDEEEDASPAPAASEDPFEVIASTG